MAADNSTQLGGMRTLRFSAVSAVSGRPSFDEHGPEWTGNFGVADVQKRTCAAGLLSAGCG